MMQTILKISARTLGVLASALAIAYLPLFLRMAMQASNMVAQIGWLLAGLAAYGVFAWLMYQWLARAKMHPIGSWRVAWEWRSLLTMLGYYGVYLLLAWVLGAVRMATEGLPKPSENQVIINHLMQSSQVMAVAMTVMAVIVAPVVEELFFRGVIITYVCGNRWWLGIPLSSVLFGYVHVPNVLAGHWLDFLQYTLMGAVFATRYWHTKQLKDSIALHSFSNFVATVLNSVKGF